MLGALCDISIGESKGFRPHGGSRDPLFVVRLGESQIVAYRNSCPHLGYEAASMAWKRDQYLDGSKQFIKCGSHGALFSLEKGECIKGPCVGASLTPEKVTVECDGNLLWWPQS